MSEEKKRIQEISELAEFVCDLGSATAKSLEDGKLSLSDSLYFVKSALAAPKAFIGISQVADEYLDLDEAEKAELKKVIAEHLELPEGEKNVEAIAENILNMAVELSSAVKGIMGALTKPEAPVEAPAQ